MRSPTLIEDELRAAFRAAADDVRPVSRPLPSDGAGRSPWAARRWLIPAVAAAAVAAITVPVLAVTAWRGPAGPDIAAASVVTPTAGRVGVAGISFPVPAGWSAKTVSHTDTSVTVCVATQPSATCDGVTLRIAVPNAAGAITPVPDPLSTDESSHRDAPVGPYGSAGAGSAGGIAPTTVTGRLRTHAPSSMAPVSEHEPTGRPGTGGAPGPATAGSTAGIGNTAGEAMPTTPAATPDPATETCPLIADMDPIDGRPAAHYSIGSCAPGSPQSADWYILDGSVAVSTPRGVANRQAAHLVAGMDLSGYRHAFGPQIAFFSGPGEASSSAVPTR